MSYPDSGHVEPGGPAAVRTVPLPDGTAVEVRKLSVGPMDNNAYLLVSGDDALLIDAAADAGRILAEVGADLRVRTILTTHGHHDHWQALEEVAAATGAEVVHHAADAGMIGRTADRHVGDGDLLRFGDAAVRLIHTPGHTPGSTSALLGDAHLFTGDTLFPGGTGRVGNPQEFEQIIRSVTEKLFDRLGDDCWVYPGHGDDTTIGTERPHLPEWRERGW
jgi:glyoxylase-like metal-dependent hydrolase (beta-lactamase superfamily II)